MARKIIKSLLKKFQVGEAHRFYREFIYNSKKLKLLEVYGFQVAGSVFSKDWELFASILVNEKASRGHGTDLATFEVKSAKIGSPFEYQYHKFTGLEKLQEDMLVNHLFISYSENYDEVIVRVLLPSQVKKVFKQWKDALRENYRDGSRRQRFRKSISFGFVKDNAFVIFQIKNGKLQKPKDLPQS